MRFHCTRKGEKSSWPRSECWHEEEEEEEEEEKVGWLVGWVLQWRRTFLGESRIIDCLQDRRDRGRGHEHLWETDDTALTKQDSTFFLLLKMRILHSVPNAKLAIFFKSQESSLPLRAGIFYLEFFSLLLLLIVLRMSKLHFVPAEKKNTLFSSSCNFFSPPGEREKNWKFAHWCSERDKEVLLHLLQFLAHFQTGNFLGAESLLKISCLVWVRESPIFFFF